MSKGNSFGQVRRKSILILQVMFLLMFSFFSIMMNGHFLIIVVIRVLYWCRLLHYSLISFSLELCHIQSYINDCFTFFMIAWHFPFPNRASKFHSRCYRMFNFWYLFDFRTGHKTFYRGKSLIDTYHVATVIQVSCL